MNWAPHHSRLRVSPQSQDHHQSNRGIFANHNHNYIMHTNHEMPETSKEMKRKSTPFQSSTIQQPLCLSGTIGQFEASSMKWIWTAKHQVRIDCGITSQRWLLLQLNCFNHRLHCTLRLHTCARLCETVSEYTFSFERKVRQSVKAKKWIRLKK